jgi:hypothetical protein
MFIYFTLQLWKELKAENFIVALRGFHRNSKNNGVKLTKKLPLQHFIFPF